MLGTQLAAVTTLEILLIETLFARIPRLYILLGQNDSDEKRNIPGKYQEIANAALYKHSNSFAEKLLKVIFKVQHCATNSYRFGFSLLSCRFNLIGKHQG